MAIPLIVNMNCQIIFLIQFSFKKNMIILLRSVSSGSKECKYLFLIATLSNDRSLQKEETSALVKDSVAKFVFYTSFES
jgi:hypothetical protein